jgi:hypothetical protein
VFDAAQLPEYFVTDDRPSQRIARPTYEALAQCQIIMVSAETGVAGSTMIEAGEIFTTEAAPNDQWLPLNRAAGERHEAWLASLPANSNGISQEEITEAAYMMRPREGEPEIPHDLWWPRVLQLAAALKAKKGGGMRVPQPAMPIRAGGQQKPVMPFMQAGTGMPIDPGRAPIGAEAPRQVAAESGRRVRQTRQSVPLANATPSESSVQTAT